MTGEATKQGTKLAVCRLSKTRGTADQEVYYLRELTESRIVWDAVFSLIMYTCYCNKFK